MSAVVAQETGNVVKRSNSVRHFIIIDLTNKDLQLSQGNPFLSE